MKPILETCDPRPDILTGTFNPEVFTASLSQVIDHYRGRSATLHNLYTNAELFFREATYPTLGMRSVLSEVMARLAGDRAVPAIHRLETAFGGGKTHTLIALAHLGQCGMTLKEVTRELFVSDIFDPARFHGPGEVTVVGVAGDEIPVHETLGAALTPYTLWGELAFQVGGETLYRALGDTVTSPAAPGRAYLKQLFEGRRVLIMLDELAQYATRLNAARPDGADQLAAFLMALHGYARTHTGIAIVLTLAGQRDAFAGQTQRLAKLLSEVRGESISEDDTRNMAASAEGGLRNVVARDATVTIPVQANEIAHVLAKRLFNRIDTKAARETAAAYADMYARSGAALPERASRADFLTELTARYPFHPIFIDFLNHKLATLENFQGTRGVLRVLSLVVRNLWQRQDPVPMIHTEHLDLHDARIVNEIFGRGGANDLLPALNTDIGSVDTGALSAGQSRAQLADQRNPHPAGFPLHEYAWKVVFLHSLVGRTEGLASNLFGITAQDALFEVAFPGMTPPQVEAALSQIESTAFYLRFNRGRGRYFASLDPSVNRALADIQGGLRDEQAQAHIVVVARSAVKDDTIFRVVHDVSLPEHIPDRTDRPVLGVIGLDVDQIEAEAFVTTLGPNRPRIQQNLVFLLVPRTVHVRGDVWNEDRVRRAQEARRRLLDLAREVIARRKLREQPENYGIRLAQLTDEIFGSKTKERELALLTTITELYDKVWFPGSTGQVLHKELHAGVGQINGQIREVLDREGELVTATRASTQEALMSLGKLFFQTHQTPTLEKLLEQFKVNRRWPVLESTAVFDTVIREGVGRGLWCLFRLDAAQSVQPETFFGREDMLPFDLDLRQPGLSIVTPQGAQQRGWNGANTEVDPQKIEVWVPEAIAEEPAMYMTNVIEKVIQNHGEVAEHNVLEAVDNLVRNDHLVTYSGTLDQTEKPESFFHGSSAMLHKVQPDDVVMAPAEAARRGWMTVQARVFELRGKDAAERLVPLFNRIGSLYSRGAHSQVSVLDIGGLDIDGGSQLRLTLQNVTPVVMKRLGELFEVLGDVVTQGEATQGQLRIEDPDNDCAFLQALKKDY